MSLQTRVVHRTRRPDAVLAELATALADPAVAAFHRLWYDTSTTWGMTRYRRLPMLKCPLDTQIYHELIMSLRPSLIIETGTAWGGSALFFADALSMAGVEGRVVTIDVEEHHPTFADHPAITRMRGSSLAAQTLAEVRQHVAHAAGPVLVSLDSEHSQAHVRAELAAYAPFVTPGSYLVVEDTNIAGHPIPVGAEDGGPYAAVEAFLAEAPAFQRVPLCERYLLTMHPGGWLRRAEEHDS